MRRFIRWFLNLLDFGWTRDLFRRQHKREVATRKASRPAGWYPEAIKNKRIRKAARAYWEEHGVAPPGWMFKLWRARIKRVA